VTQADLPSPPADRVALRKILRERRASLGAAERIAASTAIVEHLEQVPEFLTDERIAGYWAVSGELPLSGIIGGLRAREQIYFLPVVGDGQRLRFAPWRPGLEIATNRHGIPEPVCAPGDIVEADAVDVVLVPLLGFDRRGHRLGFGGGYYDRTFAFLRDSARPARPVLIGIGYAGQEVAGIEPQAWDVPLDYIATERELIDCTPAQG
jgi:5-formyltetrahydrofolate cyclo-ligase